MALRLASLSSLRLASLSATSWATVEKLVQQVLWLALFSILAPILGPKAYGEFAIAMVFIGFCELVLGDGMVDVLITLVDLDEAHVATTNLAAVVAALGLGLILACLAPAIGALFHSSDIQRLMWALAPLPLFSFLSAAPIAALRRDMQFQRIAVRSIAGLALGGAAGIAMALAGAGVWALAGQVVVQRFAEVFIAWTSVPMRFRFGWSAKLFSEMRPIAIHVFSARTMMFASAQSPRLVLGYVLGPVQVGLFMLAGRFVDMIMFTAVFPRAAVARVELRTLPSGGREFSTMFGALVRDVAMIASPLLLGAVAVMPEIYRIWLDPRWLPGVAPAQLLLLGALPLALVYCFDAAFLAAREPSLFSRTSAIQAATATATVMVCAPFGLNAACLALLVRSWAMLPLYVTWLRTKCGVASASYLWLPLRPLAGATLMVGALSLPWPALGIDERLGFVALVLLGALSYGAFCLGFARRDLRAFFAAFVAHRS